MKEHRAGRVADRARVLAFRMGRHGLIEPYRPDAPTAAAGVCGTPRPTPARSRRAPGWPG